ncbi:FG-GAP repeat protein [uncultured Pseudoteredinibacter sp.]|uniref:FG-GAP repeat protein n=1 Tax=uncultured Pseudoteredinibacter sp. TaxID=1641701 RepID=UPI002601F999|nr:FG-GAP repeat protein [uncultured Pseudoteredinibacter sp.]
MLKILKRQILLVITVFWATHLSAGQQKLQAYDGKPGDSFAFSVAIDSDTALIGAFNADLESQLGPVPDAGAAYVYKLTSEGWTLDSKLIAREPKAGDTLGGNVALKGSTAVLGVSRRDDVAEDAGAVLVFEKQSNKWEEKTWLVADDGMAGDAFGQSIALTENIMVIGAPRSDALAKDSGSAYVYQRQKGMWKFQKKLTASDGAEGDLFGISVTIDGNTVLVGADLNDEKAEKAGAVYAFVFENGKWQQQAKLMAADGGHTDIFGVRVSLSGDTALISARRDDVEGIGIDAGSAYIFERTQGRWAQQVKLISPDGKADDRFGRGVSLLNDTAIISAMNHDVNGDDAGAVYVYKRSNKNWILASKILAKDGKLGDRFGWNIAQSLSIKDTEEQSHIIIASPNRADKGVNSGVAYIQTTKQ